jgi:hypothetical protein
VKSMTQILAIVTALFIGALAGYWWRGQVLLMQEIAASNATSHIITTEPPSKKPLPLISGDIPPAKR